VHSDRAQIRPKPALPDASSEPTPPKNAQPSAWCPHPAAEINRQQQQQQDQATLRDLGTGCGLTEGARDTTGAGRDDGAGKI
jgi:hypothetical protein